MGMGVYGVAPLRLGYQNRQRIPRFYHRDELNIPDVMQRVHWDPEFARRSGNPTTFDYGRMRETWMIHLCTDWMGDDAWLWRLRVEFRQFNYVGDVAVARRPDHPQVPGRGRSRPAVDVELWARNQRDVVTTPGTATVLLPSREHGPVVPSRSPSAPPTTWPARWMRRRCSSVPADLVRPLDGVTVVVLGTSGVGPAGHSSPRRPRRPGDQDRAAGRRRLRARLRHLSPAAWHALHLGATGARSRSRSTPKDPRAWLSLMQLISRADVVVHNLAPGAAERSGIDGATLLALDPRLIVCAVSGYGTDGPFAERRPTTC